MFFKHPSSAEPWAGTSASLTGEAGQLQEAAEAGRGGNFLWSHSWEKIPALYVCPYSSSVILQDTMGWRGEGRGDLCLAQAFP